MANVSEAIRGTASGNPWRHQMGAGARSAGALLGYPCKMASFDGGSAALPNLDTMIATEFGVPVSVARDAGECTTLGAGYMADHFDMLGGVSGKND